MRSLQIVLFVLAGVAFVTQTIRHLHLLIHGGERSVLFQFEKLATIDDEVQREPSLDVLVERYGNAKREIDELEKGKSDEELKKLRKENEEKYQRYNRLEREILERERRGREIRDLWIFAGSGFILVFLGGLLYWNNIPWPGMTLILAGYSEILYWSSPSFSAGGAIAEYRQLLINKIVVSALGFVLLLVLWSARSSGLNPALLPIAAKRDEAPAPDAPSKGI